jgi:hypothetical protein
MVPPARRGLVTLLKSECKIRRANRVLSLEDVRTGRATMRVSAVSIFQRIHHHR